MHLCSPGKCRLCERSSGDDIDMHVHGLLRLLRRTYAAKPTNMCKTSERVSSKLIIVLQQVDSEKNLQADRIGHTSLRFVHVGLISYSSFPLMTSPLPTVRRSPYPRCSIGARSTQTVCKNEEFDERTSKECVWNTLHFLRTKLAKGASYSS